MRLQSGTFFYMLTRHRGIVVLGLLLVGSAATPSCSCGESTEIAQGTGTATAGSGGTAGTAGAGGSILIGGAGGVGNSGGAGGAGGGVGGVNEECYFVPPPGEFSPELDCAWDGPGPSSLYPLLDDVVMTPVVVNLTDDDADGDVDLDDIPDIVFVSYGLQTNCGTPYCGCCDSCGVLRVLSGGCNQDGTMTEHFSVGADEIEAQGYPAGIWLDNSGHVAAGDLDGDGSVDLVATANRATGTIAFERDGTVKWYQPAYPTNADNWGGLSPAIADLDADGAPEVIMGRTVLNGEDGSLAWTGTAGLGTNGFLGPVNAVADVDRDGMLNVLAGATLYDHDGTELWTYTAALSVGSCQTAGCDGFTATGNFDADDYGEIVLVRGGYIHVLNHDGTVLQHNQVDVQIQIPKIDSTHNEGGPPTVADFDGDGQSEIGVAGADYYIVADLECLAQPVPAQCSDLGIRWKRQNNDDSSRVTGSSVFDFDGDGHAEVIYNDQDYCRIMDGTTGADVLPAVANHSHTRLEMPIVADVDNDGNAEIIFVENANGGTTQGIRIWADATDSWVPTRRIWNQHAYHVTNCDELGGIPVNEEENWLKTTDATASGLMNNFRQNLPDFSVFAAPDLAVTLSINHGYCPSALYLDAEICNLGLLQVGAGLEVTFWDNETEQPLTCSNAPVVTTAPLGPGHCVTVSCILSPPPVTPTVVDARACVDNPGYDCLPDAGAGGGSSVDNGGNNECVEDNNLSEASDEGCDDGPA